MRNQTIAGYVDSIDVSAADDEHGIDDDCSVLTNRPFDPVVKCNDERSIIIADDGEFVKLVLALVVLLLFDDDDDDESQC